MDTWLKTSMIWLGIVAVVYTVWYLLSRPPKGEGIQYA